MDRDIARRHETAAPQRVPAEPAAAEGTPRTVFAAAVPGVVRVAEALAELPVRRMLRAPSQRVAYQPWDDARKNAFAAAVLQHLAGACPATDDAPAALDQTAMGIVAENSLNCAAVHDAGGRLSYATNTNGADARPDGAEQIANNVQGTHAEMVLLDQFGAQPYFGISKRCCLLCANALRIAGVGSRGNRGDLFDAWKFPTYIIADNARLTSFLGADAMAVYNAVKPEDRLAALRLVETNLKQYQR
ncbi:MAG: hypothetical protein QOE45_3018 [Frankiaceae bacterium]|jgi:hypothetical protein|nr:hypothetical protein [Frankiaceae bacterium]